MKEQLTQIILGTPYFSAGKLLMAEGVRYNHNLGGNCVFQNTALAGRLRDQGGAPSFISSLSDRLHFATLCREGSQQYLLDPFLLHREPINLTKILKQKTEKHYDAYPYTGGMPSRLVVRPTSKSTFTIGLYVFKDGSYALSREYSYDLSSEFPRLPELDDPEIARTIQRSLALRVIELSGKLHKLNLCPRTGHMGIKSINGSQELFSQKKDPEGFMDRLEQICRIIRVEAHEVLGALYQGLDIHQSIGGQNKNTPVDVSLF
jgi:hypothetical protein